MATPPPSDLAGPDGPLDRIPWSAALLVGIVAIAVYAGAMSNGLHVDDQQQIVENPWIKNPASLGEIFASDVWQHAGRESSYYRPMMYVLYMGVYLAFGLKPFAYHLLNVLLHAGASILVTLLAWDIAPRRQVSPTMAFVPAIAAGLLFATHPIHTEAVVWAAGVADVSYSFFYLLSVWLYVRAGGSGRWFALGSVFAFLVAALCKEPALTLPVVLVAYDLLLRDEKFSTRNCALRIVPFAVAAGVYLVLRFNALGGLTPVTTEVRFSVGHYAINVLFLFSKYIEALILPVKLNFWHVFEPLRSLASPAGLRTVIVVTSFLAVTVLAARKSRVTLFGLLLIVVPLLPTFHVSALNQGIENAFAERYLYLPSVGFVLAIAAVGVWILDRMPRSKTVLIFAASGLVLWYSTATVQRVPVWEDSYSLWGDVVRKSPGSAVAHQNFGFALMSRGMHEEGRRHLDMAHALDPSRVELLLKNAVAYAGRGRTKQAILEFNNAIVLDPRCYQAHYSLGVMYERQGWFDLAIQHYRKVLEIAPTHDAAHNNLGILLAERGEFRQAFEHFQAAVRLRPENPDYRANLDRLEGR